MLKTAAVFSDNMVLQRNKKIRVFGSADDGSRITVSLLGKKSENICKNGKWMVYLPEYEATEDAVMEITDGKDTITFKNIAIGEVWLAGGQSNMELELQNAKGGAEALKANPKEDTVLQKIRFYYTPKKAYECEELWEEEARAHWEVFGETDAAKWSAVGFFFAKKLAAKLGVTVGVIGCNWGGTSASVWMSREALLEHEDTRGYVEDYENSEAACKPREQQIEDYKAYERYHADWEAKAAGIYEKEPMAAFDKVQEMIGPCQYPGPMNCANFTRPYGLYEVMLKKLAPYTLGGFIFYQGETDEGKPREYYTLFSRLIRQWREDFMDEELPFHFVQLTMHRYQHDPDTKSWCILRENQMKVYRTVKNTGIAVIIDCGEFHEIHPKDKKSVGERLALQALCHTYHMIEEKNAFGPIYRDYLYADGGMELFFDYAEEGFTVKGELSGFEIAGEDQVFYPAKAHTLSENGKRNVIFVSSEHVKEPIMARYLWRNYAEVPLFGQNGLPAAPFRTHKGR
ncbi:MAG: sialate O-acetylesterase [Lachnospiraceae bacterium]|nr:sialate O-acetylesterase [Lachnospiraceae bacterium]